MESIAAEEILADADLKSIAGNHLKSITHFHLLGVAIVARVSRGQPSEEYHTLPSGE